jgi:hypothetical protein
MGTQIAISQRRALVRAAIRDDLLRVTDIDYPTAAATQTYCFLMRTTMPAVKPRLFCTVEPKPVR